MWTVNGNVSDCSPLLRVTNFNDLISRQNTQNTTTALLFRDKLHSRASIKLRTSSDSFHRTFFPHTPQPPSRHSACLLCFRLPHFLCFSFQSLPTRLQAHGTEIRRSENSEQSPLLLQLSKLCFCFCFKYPYI